MGQAIDEADGDRQQQVAAPAQRLVDQGANAPETSTEDQPNDMKLFHFAPTQKIPAE